MKKRILIPIILATILMAGCGNKNVVSTENVATEASTVEVHVAEASTMESTEVLENAVADASLGSDESTRDSSEESSSLASETSDAATTASTSLSDAKSEKQDLAKEQDVSKSQAEAPQAETPQPEPEPQQPQKPDYGRILYVGDSRSVDLFDGGAEEIRRASFNGITVYCQNACQLSYMEGAVSEVGFDNFDTLVSWMGCNDYGNFAKYEPFYDNVLSQGKNLILCTVGPTDDNALDVDDRYYYDNAREIEYNAALANYAAAHQLKVIDLYSYIMSHDSVYIDPADGIHYQPQPTSELWGVILVALNN